MDSVVAEVVIILFLLLASLALSRSDGGEDPSLLSPGLEVALSLLFEGAGEERSLLLPCPPPLGSGIFDLSGFWTDLEAGRDRHDREEEALILPPSLSLYQLVESKVGKSLLFAVSAMESARIPLTAPDRDFSVASANGGPPPPPSSAVEAMATTISELKPPN